MNAALVVQEVGGLFPRKIVFLDVPRVVHINILFYFYNENVNKGHLLSRTVRRETHPCGCQRQRGEHAERALDAQGAQGKKITFQGEAEIISTGN